MRITVGDVTLFFDVDGPHLVAEGTTLVERPTLVLLHGGPGADHSLFKPECGALRDAAQIVYLDQRGSGRSDTGPPQSWTWTQWADDVALFCAALGIERPILVGTSSGGLVAMVCAARHPELVATRKAGPGACGSDDAWRGAQRGSQAVSWKQTPSSCR